MSPQAVLAQPFTLPGGAVVKNRLFKSAMSEALGTREGAATPELVEALAPALDRMVSTLRRSEADNPYVDLFLAAQALCTSSQEKETA